MKTLEFLFSKTLLHYFWEEFLVRYRFKYVLPKVRQTSLDGVQLDLSQLSLKIRNRILMGIYEAPEKRLCQEFLTADDSVLELGGAIGFIGLFCQKNLGIRNYFVVEANPNTLEILRSNYRLNGLNVAAWNLALGPCDGTIELETASDFWENSVLAIPGHGAPQQTIRVPSASLTTLLRLVGRKVNVLIIDVEGAEQFIDWDEIPAEINKIILELHPHVLGCEKTCDLIAGLIQNGYRAARQEADSYVFLKRPEPAGECCLNRARIPELRSAVAIDVGEAEPFHS